MALAPHVWVFAWNEKLAPPTGPLEWTPRLGIATRAAVWAPHDVSFDTRCPGHGIPNTLNETTVAMARKLPVAIVHVAIPLRLPKRGIIKLNDVLIGRDEKIHHHRAWYMRELSNQNKSLVE